MGTVSQLTDFFFVLVPFQRLYEAENLKYELCRQVQ